MSDLFPLPGPKQPNIQIPSVLFKPTFFKSNALKNQGIKYMLSAAYFYKLAAGNFSDYFHLPQPV